MNSRDEDSEEASVTAHNMAENGCAAESSLKPQSGLNLQAAEDRRSRAKSKWKRLWRMSLLVLIMAVVDLLLAIPIAVYYVDFDGDSTVPQTSVCVPYEEERVCYDELKSCFPESSGQLMVSPVEGAEDLEANIDLFFQVMQASQECQLEARPLMCRYLFPPCDGLGQASLPSSEECLNVTTGVCASEWSRAMENSLIADQLPQCSNLPPTSNLSCGGNSGAPQPHTEPPYLPLPLLPPNITCRDAFAYSNSTGVCEAQCSQWEQYPPLPQVIQKVVTISTVTFSFITAIIAYVIAFVNREKVFRFPLHLVLPVIFSIVAVDVCALINYTDIDALYCHGTSVVEAWGISTPFCYICGAMRQYFFLFGTVFWFFTVCVIFWKIVFPFHSRLHQNKHNILSIVLYVVGILIPVPGVIGTFLDGGYSIVQFPPIICGAQNPAVFYYSTVFTINILGIVAMDMLIIIVWTVRLSKIREMATFKKQITLSKAEKKLMILLVYYLVFTVVLEVYFLVALKNGDKLEKAAGEFFACEAGGHNPASPCPKDYEKHTHPWLQMVLHIVLSLVPAISLVFIVNSNRVKRRAQQRFSKRLKTSKKVTSTISTDDLDTEP